MNENNGINSGVGAQTGFALQRNSAIYIILENIKGKFSSPKYFLCLEHHDDFIFCFHEENGVLTSSEVYQSKKKSPSRWTLNKDLADILRKLLQTGTRVRKDLIPKTSDYQQNLYFSSNASVFIESAKENLSVDEANSCVAFKKMPMAIQNAMSKKIGVTSICESDLHLELANFSFLYVEMPRTAKEQRNQLIGKLGEVLGPKVCDLSAAIDTLFKTFSNLELVYNQGGVGNLSDISKRVTGEDIEKTLNILTTRVKAFEYWRNNATKVACELMIKPFDKTRFENNIISSFDYFKLIDAAEHHRILKFTIENYRECESMTEEGAIRELVEMYEINFSSSMDAKTLKPIFYAAYFSALDLE